MKEILSDPFNYILYEDEEKGNYELVILANHSFCYYTRRHILSDDEKTDFAKQGKAYINLLADKYRGGQA